MLAAALGAGLDRLKAAWAAAEVGPLQMIVND